MKVAQFLLWVGVVLVVFIGNITCEDVATGADTATGQLTEKGPALDTPNAVTSTEDAASKVNPVGVVADLPKVKPESGSPVAAGAPIPAVATGGLKSSGAVSPNLGGGIGGHPEKRPPNHGGDQGGWGPGDQGGGDSDNGNRPGGDCYDESVCSRHDVVECREKEWLWDKCPSMCDTCKCRDTDHNCHHYQNRCDESRVRYACRKSCGLCISEWGKSSPLQAPAAPLPQLPLGAPPPKPPLHPVLFGAPPPVPPEIH